MSKIFGILVFIVVMGCLIGSVIASAASNY